MEMSQLDVCVAVDALDSSEWFDTDGRIGNEADPDDDGDGLNDTEKFHLNQTPMTMEFPIIGILFQSMQKEISTVTEYLIEITIQIQQQVNPADSDGDGINDMRQGLASTNATSDSGRSFDEFCYGWFLLLLLDTTTQEAI